jgi:hypothetical protein
VSFAAITLCIASQRVFIVVSVYFVIDSVRKLLDTPSYTNERRHTYRYLINATQHTSDYTYISVQYFKVECSWKRE